MTKNAVVNCILSEMIEQISCDNRNSVTDVIISDVVDGWEKQIYVIPQKAVKINHYFPKNYLLM